MRDIVSSLWRVCYLYFIIMLLLLLLLSRDYRQVCELFDRAESILTAARESDAKLTVNIQLLINTNSTFLLEDIVMSHIAIYVAFAGDTRDRHLIQEIVASCFQTTDIAIYSASALSLSLLLSLFLS